jgi:hypothetical protein
MQQRGAAFEESGLGVVSLKLGVRGAVRFVKVRILRIEIWAPEFVRASGFGLNDLWLQMAHFFA